MLQIEDIKRAVQDCASKKDISKVYLFGSYARGDAHEQSDVDLCLEAGPKFSLFDAGEFSSSMRQMLGTSVDIVSERSVYPFVKKEMLKDRVLLYEQL